MEASKELLNCLIENIDMGLEALETLNKNLEKTDNKIKKNIQQMLDNYKKFTKKCDKLRKEYKCEPTKSGLFATMMTKMGTASELKRDNSDSKVADMLIQGYNMGILDITKKLNNYEQSADKEVLNLAKEYKQMMDKAIDDIKGFL